MHATSFLLVLFLLFMQPQIIATIKNIFGLPNFLTRRCEKRTCFLLLHHFLMQTIICQDRLWTKHD